MTDPYIPRFRRYPHAARGRAGEARKSSRRRGHRRVACLWVLIQNIHGPAVKPRIRPTLLSPMFVVHIEHPELKRRQASSRTETSSDAQPVSRRRDISGRRWVASGWWGQPRDFRKYVYIYIHGWRTADGQTKFGCRAILSTKTARAPSPGCPSPGCPSPRRPRVPPNSCVCSHIYKCVICFFIFVLEPIWVYNT